MKNYDPFLNLSSAIVEVLQQYGAAKPKEIRKYLEETGWGKPPIDAVNKVLTQYLVGQVNLDKDNKWALTQENVLPSAEVKRRSVKKNDKRRHAKPHILFVCGKNQWRSPTAEHLYKNDQRIEVRSAGMSGKSRHPISNDDVAWADLILVMESVYRARILGLFRDHSLPVIENLDIPDKYEYMDDELVELIEKGVEFYIQKFEKQVSLL